MACINSGWRAGGLLFHPSSLFSPYGIGDLGPAAHKMAGFIKQAGLHFWQMLPLNPTSPALGNSPYSSFSAFAGNPLLISPELLVRDGWVSEDEAGQAEITSSGSVAFVKVLEQKRKLLDLAFAKAEPRLEHNQSFQDFCWGNGAWMNDYAFFMAAKARFEGFSWLAWPEPLRRRDEAALAQYGTEMSRPIMREKFAQFLFYSQWGELKSLAHELGIKLIGDVAIYVNHDSSDVWSQPRLFKLDNSGEPTAVAGVPPDYFAESGQLWGNPLFDWTEHQRDGFDWWKHRLWSALSRYDWVRLDHFRAFSAYWEVPAKAATAAEGYWQPGPGAELFQAASCGGSLNIIAEDLGIITPDVTELRQRFGYPGMRVLQFAFGSQFGLSTHAPFRIEPDNAVYSATHDNNTSRGWFKNETTPLMRNQLAELAGREINEENAAWELIKTAWLSPGALAVTTMQDLLNLDESSRMNTPGLAEGNWGWRMSGSDLTPGLADKMAELGALAGRDNMNHPNTLTYQNFEF